METVWRALLFGAITALGAIAAHRGYSAFHDGVRPFVRDVAAGKRDRREAGRSTWSMSWGFILYYGAPFSLATGVMEKHILGLPADWIGIRSRRLIVAAAAGLLWGISASAMLSGTQWVFGSLPLAMDHHLLDIARPLLAMMPLIPVVAATSQFGVRLGGLGVGGITLATYLVVVALELDAQAAIAFAVGVAAHLLLVMRERVDTPPQLPDMLAAGKSEIRRGTVSLVLTGALLALATSLLWLGGEPASVMLIGLGHPLEAGLIGIYSWIGFAPLVTYTALASRAYTSAGMPDGVLAMGLLVRYPPAAAVIGALAMWGELWGVGRFERLISRFPGLHGAGAGIRDGILLVSEVALFIGGALSADGMWPGVGYYVVGGFWLLNEASGRRVMRVAVGPLAAIATGLAHNVQYWLS